MSANLAEQFDRLPWLLSQHILISVIALGLGLLISLPLGVLAARVRVLRWPVLAIASVIQTIPSIALLALMVVVLIAVNAMWRGLTGGDTGDRLVSAIGFVPTIVALTLYSLLPILRNTVTGITGVDPAMTEAARALGMTSTQRFFKVELPLATPVILAGVRTATVWTVSIATLSTPVGQPSLGNYIFTGLQTYNVTAIIFGCVGAAALALGLDQLLGLLESGAAKRSRPRVIGAIIGILLVASLVFAPSLIDWIMRDGSNESTKPTATVASKPFGESYILAQLIADRLETGFTVTQKQGLGSTVAYDALRAGEVDAYVDYTGTIWAMIMKRNEVQPPETVYREMKAWLEDHAEITTLGRLGFANAYALAVRRETAERLNLKTISDLAPHADTMRIGSDPEFFGRAEWTDLQRDYGMTFREQVPMQSTLMYQAIGAGEVDVITAYTSDGRIKRYDLVTLEDDLHVLPPYDAVLLLSPTAAKNETLVERLRPLVDGITLDAMRQANLMLDVEGESIGEAAAWLDQQVESRDGDQ